MIRTMADHQARAPRPVRPQGYHPVKPARVLRTEICLPPPRTGRRSLRVLVGRGGILNNSDEQVERTWNEAVRGECDGSIRSYEIVSHFRPFA